MASPSLQNGNPSGQKSKLPAAKPSAESARVSLKDSSVLDNEIDPLFDQIDNLKALGRIMGYNL